MNLYKSLQSATYAAPRSSSNAFRKTCVKIQPSTTQKRIHLKRYHIIRKRG